MTPFQHFRTAVVVVVFALLAVAVLSIVGLVAFKIVKTIIDFAFYIGFI